MRLRSLEPFWLIKNGLLSSYPTLLRNESADIVVIGAGITGALVSHALRKSGYKVIVIDKRDVGFGSTSASTALIQYEIDVPLFKLIQKIGKEKAELCYQEGVKAVDDLENLVTSENLDCGFKKKKSLYLLLQKTKMDEFQQEFKARKSAKLNVTWKTASELKTDYGITAQAGILSSQAASLDAFKLTHDLLTKNVQRKKNPLRVYDQCEVKSFKETTKGVQVKTETGHTISARFVVNCSGFEASRDFSQKITTLKETFASTSERDDQLKNSFYSTLFWTYENPYLYLRTTDDNRLLIGGQDIPYRDGLSSPKTRKKQCQKLVKQFEKVFPKQKFIEDFSWSGCFGETSEGLPYIDFKSPSKRILYVLGFGGNGITYSVQAMRLVPLLLKGEKNKLAECYSF